VGISISMLCIIPEFCTVEVAAEEEVDLVGFYFKLKYFGKNCL